MSDLINSLINSFFVGEDSEIRDLKYKLLSHEYELKLERVGFDLNKIYKTKDGRWKVSSPIQVCRSNKDDCLKILYEHFYGKFEKTLNDVYELWIKSFENLAQQGHRSSITLDGYIGYYRKYISTSSLENMPISKIKPITLYNFYAECAARGKMTRKALNNLKSLVNHIFDYAVLNEYSQTNPAKLVNTKDLVLADQDNSKKVYSKEDRIKLMNLFRKNRHDPYANALTVLFCTGMRSGEVRALKKEDIDFEKKTIFVHREMVRRKNSEGKMTQICLNHTKAKKEGGNRVIPITRDALEALKRQMELNSDGEFIFMVDEHVFVSKCLIDADQLDTSTACSSMSSFIAAIWSRHLLIASYHLGVAEYISGPTYFTPRKARHIRGTTTSANVIAFITETSAAGSTTAIPAAASTAAINLR